MIDACSVIVIITYNLYDVNSNLCETMTKFIVINLMIISKTKLFKTKKKKKARKTNTNLAACFA